MATLRINLRYGNVEALKGLSIASQLLPEMLNRGSENMTRQEISDQLNNYRAQMRVSGAPGTLSVSVQTSRENLVSARREVECLQLEQKTFAQAEQAWIYRAIVSGSALQTQWRVNGEAGWTKVRVG